MGQISRGYTRARRGLLIMGGLAVLLCSAMPGKADGRGDPDAVTFLVGRGTDTDFTDIITEPWTTHFVDLTMVGLAASHRLDTLGEDFTIDLEGGAAYRFGEEDQGEFWGALYLRYDGFPWNDTIYTTVALNTGLSYLTETSEFERDRSDGQSSQVLHNFSPEITLADPDNKNVELVLRLQHRSGIFGLIDGVTGGSTFVTTGLRFRF
jgi:hypothetical protein